MCQFSYYCDGKSDRPTEEDAWQSAVLAAFGAMTERTYDPTEGATHYHADYVQPEWAEVKYRTVRINDHIFYKWEGNR
jgi:spore germination cell wall hydrolase CwlJ-like protein